MLENGKTKSTSSGGSCVCGPQICVPISWTCVRNIVRIPMLRVTSRGHAASVILSSLSLSYLVDQFSRDAIDHVRSNTPERSFPPRLTFWRRTKQSFV